MEKIDKIPDNFLMEMELSREQEIIFIEQINRFNALNEMENNPSSPIVDENGKLMLKEGMLIHGISGFSNKKLDSISKSGILTGQAVGVSEDGETYYCADFHRVKEDISIEDYNKWFRYNDGRCPFGKRADFSREVAFIITPTDENRELLKYDCYRDTTEGLATRSYVNYMPMKSEVASSILYGVPVVCFNGIVVGGKIINDKEKIDYLIEKFPHCYIVSSFGELLYNPCELNISLEEGNELRRKVSLYNSFQRLKKAEEESMNKEIESLKNEKEKLMSVMCNYLKNEDIRNILMGIGWQSVSDGYIEMMRKGR